MPLSRPNSGLIFSGEVKEVLGNWTGTKMNLQLFCDPDDNYQDRIYFQCRPHQPLKEAIALAFQNAGLEADVSSIPERTKCPQGTGLFEFQKCFYLHLKTKQ